MTFTILFSVFVVLGIAAVTFVLPVVTFLRVTRALRELNALRARLAALEDERRGTRAPAAAVTATPTREDFATAPVASAPDVPAAVPEAPPGAATLPTPAAPEPAPEPRALNAPASAVRPGATARLESAIGERLLLYAGIVVFVLGIGFFVKYAFDRAWITEGMRVALGALSGMLLIAGGLRLARAGYATYGNMLAGGGVAALYLAAYAAFNFYDLIGRGAASGAFLAITAGAAFLADRQRAQGMAILAVGGGFLTPFLVGGRTDAQITLFSYVALLIAGTMALARRRDWPLLNVVSYGLTVLTIAAWAATYYTPAKYLRTELFLTLYCVMFLVVLRQTARGTGHVRDLAVLVLATAPILYHVVSLQILWPHDVAAPVYLILFALAGTFWSIQTGGSGRRIVIWMATFVPFLAWAADHQSPGLVLPSMTTLAALFSLPLLAQIDRIVRRDERLDGWDFFLLHVNAVAAFAGVWIVLAEVAVVWVPRVGLLLALLHALLARWLHVRRSPGALHALGATFALIAATVAVEFDGRWLTAAWAAEGAAVLWVGLRVRREPFRLGGAALLAAAAARWLLLSVPETAYDFALIWNETFALGLWIIGLLYLMAWFHARSRSAEAEYPRTIAALLVASSVLTVVLLTAQNTSYWKIRSATLADATFAEQLALSLLWAFYGAALIVAGVRREYAPIRYTGIVLIAITTVKVFLVDLAGLQGIYRVLGLLVVGAVLLAISFLYQRSSAHRPENAEEQQPPAA